VSLLVCDVTGRLVRTLFRGPQPAGEHRINWDVRDDEGQELPTEKYFYRAQVGDEAVSRGMVLVR
jgi:flagellar hook assembly protein FlgD